MKTAQAKSNKKESSEISILVEEMTKVYHDSLKELLDKFQFGSKTRTYNKLKKYKDRDKKEHTKEEKTRHEKNSAYKMFLEALKQIGRPAMTREIASRFKLVHPTAPIPKNKKLFMQQLYNSASYLSKEGLILRSPVGKRMFEYSLNPKKVEEMEEVLSGK